MASHVVQRHIWDRAIGRWTTRPGADRSGTAGRPRAKGPNQSATPSARSGSSSCRAVRPLLPDLAPFAQPLLRRQACPDAHIPLASWTDSMCCGGAAPSPAPWSAQVPIVTDATRWRPRYRPRRPHSIDVEWGESPSSASLFGWPLATRGPPRPATCPPGPRQRRVRLLPLHHRPAAGERGIVERPLTDEQKTTIAEARRVYDAKVAERDPVPRRAAQGEERRGDPEAQRGAGA